MIFIPVFWLLKKYEYNTPYCSDFAFQNNRIHEQKHIQLRSEKNRKQTDTPSRSSRLIKEAGWFVLIAITLYFLLIFLSYDKTDPGWSHASQITHISNLGGRIGAFIADILFFTFGLSAWWVVLWFLKASWTGYKRISRLLLLQEEPEPSWFRDRILKNIGFLILLFSSSGVEYLRMYNMRIQLPRIPGGVVGEIVGNTAQHYLGFSPEPCCCCF